MVRCIINVVMELTLTTPALLFPAISLLLLAYTNRFLTLASLVRGLHDRYTSSHDEITAGQIDNLRYRLGIIRNMQVFGVSSFFLCVLCMFVLFLGQELLGKFIFGASLILLLISLGLSLREVQVSVDALRLELQDVEDRRQ